MLVTVVMSTTGMADEDGPFAPQDDNTYDE